MSYEAKKDEMVGKYVAEFQEELSLARQMKAMRSGPSMPYGYPVGLYHPYHSVMLPKKTRFVPHEHHKLSNDVPWVLGLDVVDENVVGVYNPKVSDEALSD